MSKVVNLQKHKLEKLLPEWDQINSLLAHLNKSEKKELLDAMESGNHEKYDEMILRLKSFS